LKQRKGPRIPKTGKLTTKILRDPSWLARRKRGPAVTSASSKRKRKSQFRTRVKIDSRKTVGFPSANGDWLTQPAEGGKPNRRLAVSGQDKRRSGETSKSVNAKSFHIRKNRVDSENATGKKNTIETPDPKELME